tara:strand:- start:205 stop:384 length:180 start_codon:yes stop_codon:yes gene_type:complete
VVEQELERKGKMVLMEIRAFLRLMGTPPMAPMVKQMVNQAQMAMGELGGDITAEEEEQA